MLASARSYAVPLLLAVGIHAVAAWSLYVGWNPDTVRTRVIEPRIVNSTLVMMQPKAPRKAAPKPKVVQPTPRLAPAAARRPAPGPKSPATALERRRSCAPRTARSSPPPTDPRALDGRSSAAT